MQSMALIYSFRVKGSLLIIFRGKSGVIVIIFTLQNKKYNNEIKFIKGHVLFGINALWS